MTDLAEFVARHAKPYNPATDTYRRPPFAVPVKAGKNTTIYNAHSYHTKVPPQGIVPYIKHYTDPGDLVLDPFCGSGMTGVACLAAERHAVLSDLSPAAVHITNNYCTTIDLNALRREYERIKSALSSELDWLFGTTCDRCGAPAAIEYCVWSDVYECSRCGAELLLWDVAVDHELGTVHSSFSCPVCGKQQTKRHMHWLRSVPVVTNYRCTRCKPSTGQHRITEAEKRRISEIEAQDIPYWYPTTPFCQYDWEMWRGVHRDQGITDVSKFYTKRSLWAFAAIFAQIKQVSDPTVRSKLLFAFTGVVDKANKRNKWIPGKVSYPFPIQSGALYVPSLSREYSPWKAFQNKLLLRVASAVRELGIPSTQAVATVSSASSLGFVPNHTIDYIFTDPPFGSNIFYADCNLIWEAWLNQGLTDQTQEAVVHVKHKDKNTLPDYARLMSESFAEMHRVLKPGRWASVVFHNSDDRIWQIILDAAETAGFELAEINSFDKQQLSFKGIRGAKGLERVTNKDIVLNLHKPRAPLAVGRPSSNADAPQPVRGNGDSEIRIVECIAAYLAGNPAPEGRTLQALWNTALGEMIRAGVVEASMEDVGLMLPHYFKEVDGRWYLRGEAVLGGNVFEVTSDAGAIAWLTAVLGEPWTTGELIPEWQTITAQAGGMAPGRLERLLEENFWLDKRTGRWRAPTQAERGKMSAHESLKDQAHLRVVRRFLAGQLPQQPSPLELSAWVQFCYSHQAYEEAVRLFSLLDPASIDKGWYGRLKRVVAVCRSRAGGASGANQ